MSFWGQLGMQESTTVLGVELSELHDHLMFFSVLVFSFVGFLLFKILVSVYSCRVVLEKQWLEFVWTLLPLGVLLAMGLPSVQLLYVMEDVGVPQITMKVNGHQWYWSYEYCDLGGKDNVSFDSYMVSDKSLGVGGYRLLEVDNRFVVPFGVPVRVLVSSSDVVHSWAIPSAGIKVDGIAGRINQVGLNFWGPGVVYGQCSELCGVNHSFMPICGEAVSCEVYALWLLPKGCPVTKGVLDYCREWGYMILSGCGQTLVWAGKLYVAWWEFFAYYFVYMPVKLAVDGTGSVVVGGARTCYGFIEWGLWLMESPMEACDYAAIKVDEWFEQLVMVFIVGPVSATWSAFGTIGSVIVGVCRGVVQVIETLVGEVSGPGDSSTKRFVVEELRVQLVRLFRTLVSRFYDD